MDAKAVFLSSLVAFAATLSAAMAQSLPGPWPASCLFSPVGRRSDQGFTWLPPYFIPRCETRQDFCGSWARLRAVRGRFATGRYV
jgi:hypothetical protein